MIDPRKMTRYRQTDHELEETLLFCVCAAGKNAMTSAKGLNEFLTRVYRFYEAGSWGVSPVGPFGHIRQLFADKMNVSDLIRQCGLGCYNQRARTFRALVDANLDLRTCTTDDLEKVPGIGLKTSRFFILHSRRDAGCAIIDTHVVKYLRYRGYPVPEKTTLTAKRYKQYEEWFLEAWRSAAPETSLAAFDLSVWNHYAGHSVDLSLI